ncbi:hypothetical protein C8R44DRAFT_876812 [Mycena epipterygia]|nr:hypothetical protein C8R44DRAFT_876812 [Mycena epipterygia]
MSHISYVRLTHADAEKDRKDKGPSTEEVRANARAQVHVCSTCGENPGVAQLKNCAGCRTTRYCSKKCQVSDWPVHKQTCAGSASSTDINLKLAKKLMANDYLMFYIKVYAVLALELLTAPENALDTCLLVNITTRDADPLAAMRALINREERGPGISVMLQIASIEKKPLMLQTTPAMRSSLEKAKAGLGTRAESFNNNIYMDKENRYLLHTKSKN